MLNYYKMALTEKYADFSTRSTRSEYWYFVLTNTIIYIILMSIAGIGLGSMFSNPDALDAGMPMISMIAYVLYILYALAVLIPGIAIAVRRLHDTGKSGWTYFIILIPILGIIALLIFLCTPSESGTNKWGPNPYELDEGYDVSGHLVKEDLV